MTLKTVPACCCVSNWFSHTLRTIPPLAPGVVTPCTKLRASVLSFVNKAAPCGGQAKRSHLQQHFQDNLLASHPSSCCFGFSPSALGFLCCLYEMGSRAPGCTGATHAGGSASAALICWITRSRIWSLKLASPVASNRPSLFCVKRFSRAFAKKPIASGSRTAIPQNGCIFLTASDRPHLAHFVRLPPASAAQAAKGSNRSSSVASGGGGGTCAWRAKCKKDSCQP